MHSFIEHYRCGHLIDLPPYHGCNATNKNGTRKLIRYEIGKQCVSPTWKCYWKKPSEIRPKYKKKIGVFYWARHMTQTISRYLFKNKGNFFYNYKLKKYVHMKHTPMVYDFKDIQKFKHRYLRSIENQCRYLRNSLAKKKIIHYYRVSVSEGLNTELSTSDLMLEKFDKKVFRRCGFCHSTIEIKKAFRK